MSHTDEKDPNQPSFETTDVEVSVVLKFGVVLVIMIALSALGSWVIFRLLFADAVRADPKFSPLAVLDRQPPPEPRLIENEPSDLDTVRQQEQAVLENYEWVDRGGGVVRIPIERAMELLAKEAPQR